MSCLLCGNFISIYIINRTLHGRLGIRILSSRTESISHSLRSLVRRFQHLKIKFVSPRGHVISSILITGRLKFSFRLSSLVVDCRRRILPSCMVAGKSKIFIEYERIFYKLFVLDNSVVCTFSFLVKIVKCELGTAFSTSLK